MTGAPIRDGSGSTKPTMSTPSSCRRAKSSRASSTAAVFVPTSSRRSRGDTRRVSQANAARQAMTNVIMKATEMTKTPRPMIQSGTR